MTFKLEGITQDEITLLKTSLQKEGVSVVSPNGASPLFFIKGHGVEAHCSFTGSDLEVQVNQKPFFVTHKMIEAAITKYLPEYAPGATITEEPETES